MGDGICLQPRLMRCKKGSWEGKGSLDIRCQTSDTPDKILFNELRPKDLFRHKLFILFEEIIKHQTRYWSLG